MTDETQAEQQEDRVLTPAATVVVHELRKLRLDLVSEIRQLGEQRGEKPGLFNIWPTGHLSTQRIRAEKLVITSIAAAGISLALRVGGSTMLRIRQMEGTDEYDFPFLIQQGQTLELIDIATGISPTTADLLDAWVTGFTE